MYRDKRKPLIFYNVNFYLLLSKKGTFPWTGRNGCKSLSVKTFQGTDMCTLTNWQEQRESIALTRTQCEGLECSIHLGASLPCIQEGD